MKGYCSTVAYEDLSLKFKYDLIYEIKEIELVWTDLEHDQSQQSYQAR